MNVVGRANSSDNSHIMGNISFLNLKVVAEAAGVLNISLLQNLGKGSTLYIICK
jgi:hypothetical protein